MAFKEGYVEADGFRIRYMEDGHGPPLMHLHGAGGLRLTPGHDLLSRHFRVVAFEMPGFGQSPENTRTESMPELASTMAQAVKKLGLDTFNLMGTSFGGTTALWLALQAPERVLALVLEAPAAIRPEGAHRPRVPPRRSHAGSTLTPSGSRSSRRSTRPSGRRRRRLVQRLRGPDRDADLEGRPPGARRRRPSCCSAPSISVIAPAMGRVYKELIPNCHLVFVYDAGHAISTDRPEAFAEVVVDFLERHEAFVISRAETVIHP